MSDIKDTLKDAGQKAVDTAKHVGHKVADGARAAVDFVKEKTGIGSCSGSGSECVSKIKERMDVIASCGTKVGVVDHVEGDSIKLTRSDSPDGQHHFVPTAWVGRVHENHVHLTKNSAETESGWKSDAAACASCGG